MRDGEDLLDEAEVEHGSIRNWCPPSRTPRPRRRAVRRAGQGAGRIREAPCEGRGERTLPEDPQERPGPRSGRRAARRPQGSTDARAQGRRLGPLRRAPVAPQPFAFCRQPRRELSAEGLPATTKACRRRNFCAGGEFGFTGHRLWRGRRSRPPSHRRATAAARIESPSPKRAPSPSPT